MNGVHFVSPFGGGQGEDEKLKSRDPGEPRATSYLHIIYWIPASRFRAGRYDDVDGF